MNELEAFEIVGREIADGRLHTGLWTKCFTECDGEKSKTAAAYARQRVKMLLSEAQAKEQTSRAEATARWHALEKRVARLRYEIYEMPYGMPSDRKMMQDAMAQLNDIVREHPKEEEGLKIARTKLENLFKERDRQREIIETARRHLSEGNKVLSKKMLRTLGEVRFGDLDYQHVRQNWALGFGYMLLLAVVIVLVYAAFHR